MNSTPVINITVLDETAARQEEARELYLKWLSEQEVRLKSEERPDQMRPSPNKRNVDSCTW